MSAKTIEIKDAAKPGKPAKDSAKAEGKGPKGKGHGKK